MKPKRTLPPHKALTIELQRLLANAHEQVCRLNRAVEEVNEVSTRMGSLEETMKLLDLKWDATLQSHLGELARHFPGMLDQYNRMAGAINKISAFAAAVDESGKGLKQLTLKRITKLEKRGESESERVAKLKHRLKRMEQKL